MAWQEPKTDWQANPKNPVPEDFNRIEGNIDFLKSDIETKKGAIVDAITDMNKPAEVTDSHAQLADKIRDISNDATAVVGDVESGKTFYSAGAKKTGTLALSGTAGTGDVLSGKTFYNTALKTKRTGTMPNQGAVVITPGTSNKAIVAGYHNGQGYVKGDANLIAGNIKKGVSIFGVMGSVSTTVVGQQNSNYVRVSSKGQTVSSSVSLTNAGVVFGAACFTEQSDGTPQGCKLFINNVEVASGGGRWSPIVAGYRAASAGTGTAKAQHTSGSTGSVANLEVYVFGASV